MEKNFIKSGAGYLIWLKGCRWDGADGFRLVDHPVSDTRSLLYRGYDCDVKVVKVSRGRKYVRTLEYSHDKPTGYNGHILALSEEEVRKAKRVFQWGSIDSVQQFFKGYLD